MTQDKNALDQEGKEETAPALDIKPILAIHRGSDGYIAFVRKPDPANPVIGRHGEPKQIQPLFSIRASELSSMFPTLVEWLTHDSYFSVCSFYRPARWKNPLTGLPDAWRRETDLHELGTLYSDIDCGRPDSEEPGASLTSLQAQNEVLLLAHSGAIPYPSIIAHSGRGVYLFWILRDEKDPNKPPAAWPETIPLYKACNRALDIRLRDKQLPADMGAFDAARVLRVPGSINRKTGRLVTYFILYDQNGKGLNYTLSEMAATLGLLAPGGGLPEKVRELARPPLLRRIGKRGSAPLRSMGTLKRNALRAQDLRTIEAWRGGFLKRGMKYPDGHSSPGRRLMLTIYAEFLKGSNADKAEALKALRDMAANMRPPWPDEPGDQIPETIIRETYSKTARIWGNKKLCEVLGITADLARELDLKTIRPKVVALEADQARPTRAEYVKWRREIARQYRELFGYATTADSLARFYREKRILGANRETANQDLNAIGYKMQGANRSRGGRPRKTLISRKV